MYLKKIYRILYLKINFIDVSDVKILFYPMLHQLRCSDECKTGKAIVFVYSISSLDLSISNAIQFQYNFTFYYWHRSLFFILKIESCVALD